MCSVIRIKAEEFNDLLAVFVDGLEKSDIYVHVGYYSNHALCTKICLMLLDSISNREVVFDFSFSSWCLLRLTEQQQELLANLRSVLKQLIVEKTDYVDYVDILIGIDTLILIRG